VRTILAVEKGFLVPSSGLESINLLLNPVPTTRSYVYQVIGSDYLKDFIHQTPSLGLDLKLGEVAVNASAFSNMPIDYRLFRRHKCHGNLAIVLGIALGVPPLLLVVVRKERKEKE
jgi:hypothetical protein